MIPISNAEKSYIKSGITQNLREDGRKNLDFRSFKAETNVIPQTNGSARVRLGKTEVLIGVKVEIGDPEPAFPDEGRAELYIEISPSVSKEFEEKRGGTEKLESALVSCLKLLIHNSFALDWKKLSINSGTHCWVVYIDCLVLDSSGNVFDACSLGMKAALSTTKIPKIEKIEKKSDDDDNEGRKKPKEIEITLSENPDDFEWMETDAFPIGITVGKIGEEFVVDPSLKEEKCLDDKIFVCVNESGKICGCHTTGPAPISPQELKKMIQIGKVIASNVHTQLSQFKKKEEQHNLY